MITTPKLNVSFIKSSPCIIDQDFSIVNISNKQDLPAILLDNPSERQRSAAWRRRDTKGTSLISSSASKSEAIENVDKSCKNA